MLNRTLTNRFERKYVIDIKTYQRVKRALEPFMIQDPRVGKYGKYRVLSTYYDSNQFHAFTEKIEGEKIRSKVRLRVYEQLGKANRLRENTQVFLEIKKKNNLTVSKDRIKLPYLDAINLIENPIIDRSLLKRLGVPYRTVLGQVALLKEQKGITPKILIHYVREPFMSKFGLNLRVTFDSYLKYRRGDLRLVSKSTDKHFLPPNLMIMEVKYNDILPVWVIDILQRNNCQLIAFSKYCNGLISDYEYCGNVTY